MPHRRSTTNCRTGGETASCCSPFLPCLPVTRLSSDPPAESPRLPVPPRRQKSLSGEPAGRLRPEQCPATAPDRDRKNPRRGLSHCRRLIIARPPPLPPKAHCLPSVPFSRPGGKPRRGLSHCRRLIIARPPPLPPKAHCLPSVPFSAPERTAKRPVSLSPSRTTKRPVSFSRSPPKAPTKEACLIIPLPRSAPPNSLNHPAQLRNREEACLIIPPSRSAPPKPSAPPAQFSPIHPRPSPRLKSHSPTAPP